jgi:hypothetical protein
VLDDTAGDRPRVMPVPGEVILRESTSPRPPADQPPANRPHPAHRLPVATSPPPS